MKKAIAIIKEIVKLPRVSIKLSIEHEEGKRIFDSFTKRHPRIPIFANKAVGVAIIDLANYSTKAEYLSTVNGKNSAAYFSRKAEKCGYKVDAFNPNQHQQEILEIHFSNPDRQGKSLPENYKTEIQYPINNYNKYYAAIINGKIVGYIWTIESGELVVMNRIMGHQDFMKDGLMYLLATEVIAANIPHDKRPKYMMYDTFFGASEGLKMYKKRLGFNPFKVNWTK
jgi:hypothetical protein